MAQLKTSGAPASPDESVFDYENLTRDQKIVLARILGRFRDNAVVQVLTGPRESGKSTIAQAVASSLRQDAVAVIISKQDDQSPAKKRMMLEAYCSYTQLLSAVLKQLGFFARAKDRNEEEDLVVQMVEHLRKIRSENKRLLIILDDAHDISPGVWKRFQSWLEYQDRGKRMIQVLLVGSPLLKKMLGEPALRSWRRWIHGRHELQLLKGGTAVDETRRILKRSCESLSRRTRSETPLTAPPVTWFAIRKLLRESGGRPGRLTELVRRVLTASLREGGCRITWRFLRRADALRAPASDLYKARRTAQNQGKAKQSFPSEKKKMPNPAPEKPRSPAGPVGWMQYALGGLLVIFLIGAGWGVRAWLSLPEKQTSETLVEAVTLEDTAPPVEEEPTELAGTSSSWEDAYSGPVTESVEGVLVEEAADLGGSDEGDPWGDSSTRAEDGWKPIEQVAGIPATGSLDSALPTTETGVSPASPTGPDLNWAEPEKSGNSPTEEESSLTLATKKTDFDPAPAPSEAETEPEPKAPPTERAIEETVSVKPGGILSPKPVVADSSEVSPVRTERDSDSQPVFREKQPGVRTHRPVRRLRLREEARKELLEKLERLRKTLEG